MDVSSPSLPSKTLKQLASAQVTCIAFEETSVLPEAELINSQHLFLTRAHVRHISCSRRWAPSAACIRSRAAAGRRFVAAACGQHDPRALQPESRQRRRFGSSLGLPDIRCNASGSLGPALAEALREPCHGPGLQAGRLGGLCQLGSRARSARDFVCRVPAGARLHIMPHAARTWLQRILAFLWPAAVFACLIYKAFVKIYAELRCRAVSFLQPGPGCRDAGAPLGTQPSPRAARRNGLGHCGAQRGSDSRAPARGLDGECSVAGLASRWLFAVHCLDSVAPSAL